MNSIQIKYFLEAVKCLSFTKAAENLFITQPTLSRSIASLEADLGVTLFDRDDKRKQIRLTSAGAAFYEEVAVIYNNYERLVKKIRSMDHGKTGQLAVGFLGGEFADERAITVIRNFCGANPDVAVTIRQGTHQELTKWLRERTLDVAFILEIDIVGCRQVVCDYLYDSKCLLAVSAYHRYADCLPNEKGLADFADDIFIGFEGDNTQAVDELLRNECRKVGFHPNVVKALDMQAQILMVETNLGVAIVGNNSLATVIPSIRTLELKDLIPMKTVMAWNKNNYNPCLAEFNRFCVNSFKE